MPAALRLLLAGLALTLLASCATLSEDQCRDGNWAAIGFSDGADGRPASWIAEHRKACAEFGVVPDAAAWAMGREQGLKQYCTPDNAYRIGSRGLTLAPVCPQAARAAMQPAYQHGRRFYDAGDDIADYRREQRDLEREIAALEGVKGAGGRIANLRHRINLIDLYILQLEAERRRYARWPR